MKRRMAEIRGEEFANGYFDGQRKAFLEEFERLDAAWWTAVLTQSHRGRRGRPPAATSTLNTYFNGEWHRLRQRLQTLRCIEPPPREAL